MSQLGFFALSDRYEQLSPMKDPLERLSGSQTLSAAKLVKTALNSGMTVFWP